MERKKKKVSETKERWRKKPVLSNGFTAASEEYGHVVWEALLSREILQPQDAPKCNILLCSPHRDNNSMFQSTRTSFTVFFVVLRCTDNVPTRWSHYLTGHLQAVCQQLLCGEPRNSSSRLCLQQSLQALSHKFCSGLLYVSKTLLCSKITEWWFHIIPS